VGQTIVLCGLPACASRRPLKSSAKPPRIRSVTTVGAILLLLLAPLSAATLAPSADGTTFYDSANNITWLANANLALNIRFGLPACDTTGITQTCVETNGSMSYQSAAAWVAAMNAAQYLGHTNWQLPTSPPLDSTCPKIGTNGTSFGFGCLANAMGSLFYNGLGLKAPNTAVPIGANTAGPFTNFQPYLYWSQSPGSGGYATFSFATGFQGANTAPNFLYLLPMVPGKLAGTPAASGNGLQVNPGGQTIYDPQTNITWLANANLAAGNTFGLPPCQNPTTPTLCVARDGAMTWDSANQFLANMNAAAYLGQKNWQMPTVDPNCTDYNCDGTKNPMGNLFYDQLGLIRGESIVATPNLAVGPLRNLQPYLYWSCEAATIQSACSTDEPAPNFEFSFSFGSGFQGTDLLANSLYVIPYFVGAPTPVTGPVINAVVNAESGSPIIAPNTWIEIAGINLAPAGDARTWTSADFVNGQMPTELDGVSATVNGKSAYVAYISATQVNILSRPDAISGLVNVVLTGQSQTGAAFTAQAQLVSPAFFVVNGGPYVVAEHADGSYISTASPAKPGEIIVLYANGFGSTTQPVVQIGGVAASIQYAGLVGPGLYQINIGVPPSLSNGDQPITASAGGASTQNGTLITIHN